MMDSYFSVLLGETPKYVENENPSGLARQVPKRRWVAMKAW